MKKQSKIIILSIMIIIFFILGFMVKGTKEGILFDISILDLIHNNTHSPIMFSIMNFISFIGSGKFLIPIVAMALSYFLIKQNYYITKLLLLSTIGSYALNLFLKLVFQRTRPINYMLTEKSGLAYPSGHSMVAMSLYATIAFLLVKNRKNDNYKKLINTIFYILILLIGYSRLYLGHHWPTDVIGGYLIGYIVYQLSIISVKE